MKLFYLKTDKFWIFSRIFFTLLLIIAVIKVFFLDTDFEPRNIFGFSILAIYISLMILILLRRVYKKTIPSTVKLTTGISSILIGLLMSYSILTNPNTNELLKIGFHFVPVWIILLGLRDVLLYQNHYSIEYNQSMATD
ncbi:hypothetical protein BC962_3240 [Gillisia mitskevichiae]|uniref:Uncharacterized protein n=2 Tax=Gillisia mitskevichiae TaxID=270921 RepID=A0A495NWW8_9FLAO|nr:hypothetical protein BC962_3240 [Gillisia mitskevichiae]